MTDRNPERRSDIRIRKNIPLKIFSKEKIDEIVETENISASGAYCNLDFNIPEMTKLEITLLIPRAKKMPAKKIDCEGVVVRKERNAAESEKAYSIAIFFNKIDKADKKFINQYVKHHTQS